MTPEHAYALAGDFIRELGPLHADPSAVDAVCLRWLSVLGAHDYGVVNAAAVRSVFADCLTTSARTDVPPGSVEFIQQQEAIA
jgi:hypothetical protein